MSEIERLYRNLKHYIEMDVLDDEFGVFISENPELDSISDLNEIMENEMSCWEYQTEGVNHLEFMPKMSMLYMQDQERMRGMQDL